MTLLLISIQILLLIVLIFGSAFFFWSRNWSIFVESGSAFRVSRESEYSCKTSYHKTFGQLPQHLGHVNHGQSICQRDDLNPARAHTRSSSTELLFNHGGFNGYFGHRTIAFWGNYAKDVCFDSCGKILRQDCRCDPIYL